MGFPTPFPEPDSPELQRFAVSSSGEIVSLLYALQETAVPLNAYVDTGALLGVVTLNWVGVADGQLVFKAQADEGLSGRLIGAPLATFVGFDHAGKVQFDAAPVPRRAVGGREFTTSIPEQLFRLQRRSAARVRLDGAKAAICRIPVPGGTGEREALCVLDIGAGGIAVLAYPKRFEVVIGAEIDECRLDLPGVGGATVSLRVRHLGPQSDEGQARYCGFEFVRMTPGLQSMLAEYFEGQFDPLRSAG